MYSKKFRSRESHKPPSHELVSSWMLTPCQPNRRRRRRRGRRQGRQRKRWEDNIREWTGLEFGKFHRAVKNRQKKKKTGCEIICGAPTTLAVKG